MLIHVYSIMLRHVYTIMLIHIGVGVGWAARDHVKGEVVAAVGVCSR